MDARFVNPDSPAQADQGAKVYSAIEPPTCSQETLDLSLELNPEMANMYPCQALQGSPMCYTARRNGWAPPDSYEGYAFLSYESQPLPIKHLSAAEVLKFRDDAWHKYSTNSAYLNLVERRFGSQEKEDVEEMTTIRLNRRILGDLF